MMAVTHWETGARRRAISTAAVVVSVVVVALVASLAFALTYYQPSQSTTSAGGTSTTSTLSSAPGGSSASSSVSSTASASSTTSFAYLSDYGGCKAGGLTAPCWGGTSSSGHVFDCSAAASSPQGCTQTVTTNPPGSYTINIRFPFTNQTAPAWANCLWSVPGEVPPQGWGHCVPVSPTAFVIGEPAGARQ